MEGRDFRKDMRLTSQLGWFGYSFLLKMSICSLIHTPLDLLFMIELRFVCSITSGEGRMAGKVVAGEVHELEVEAAGKGGEGAVEAVAAEVKETELVKGCEGVCGYEGLGVTNPEA
ncbi:methionine synthase 2 [Striga asiatica]|uniref:Methionine synthase 2 n=1 Tax=Striga asiatica TaxID=4170 RepID=A0A5A7QFU5_STRAF|nr:methionine synthase 2 [Striga asiatica]